MIENKKISGNLFDFKVLSRIFNYAKPYRSLFYFLILLTVLAAVLAIAKPIVIQYTIDEYILNNDKAGLNSMFLLLGILLLGHGFVMYLNTYIAGVLGQSVIRDVRIQLFKHLLKFRLSYFDKTPIGRLVTRNVSDIESLSNVFSEGFAGIVSDLLLIVAILGVMFYTSWKLTLFSLGALPLLIVSSYIFKESVKKSFNMVRNAVANLNTFVQEHITGMFVVQLFGAEKREFEKFDIINQTHRNANLKSVFYYSLYFPVAEIISAVSIAMLVWYGTGDALQGFTTPGIITSFLMYVTMFFRPIRMIADRFNTMQMAIVSSERVFQLLDDQENVESQVGQQTPTLKGEIQFKEVWFAYSDDNFVLKNISFEVKQGNSLAFVGATGAGKSSIINLLNRFYPINKGQILIDGFDISTLDNASLRKQIGVVLQDVFLFSDSIRNNIRLDDESITDEKIMAAAEMVGAKKFIDKLPGGLDYQVQERGNTLSVGQRQLISFIRTMVYDPKILILDEATASIDSDTEEMIQKAIDTMLKGRTSIVVAHRLSTIQKADEIVVLEKGEIVESGSHDKLLKQNGYYANLYELQFVPN